jgi:hypothetical protein
LSGRLGHLIGWIVFRKGRTLIAIEANYKKLPASKSLIATAAYADLMAELCRASFQLLHEEGEEIPLISQVPNKTYFAFRRTITTGKHKDVVRHSRPVNRALFIQSAADFGAALGHFLSGDYSTLGEPETTRLLYTCAMSFCAVNDIHTVGDKKTPATFFELFISHLFARLLGVLPKKRVSVPSAYDEVVTLPTDIIFDLGKTKVKFHVPVKLSTRERVIQAWAHQKVLDGIWGNQFKGLLVVLTETKLDLKKLEVVEICLPGQWQVYQRYIARLERVYYLDVPVRYAALSSGTPRIDVKTLGSLFFETDTLLSQ